MYISNSVGGFNVTPNHKELSPVKNQICTCSGIPPRVGVPLTFWEPIYLVDITRKAYQLIGLGGLSIGKDSIKNRGTVAILGEGPIQTSTYHIHWYKFPILSLLKLFTDFIC